MVPTEVVKHYSGCVYKEVNSFGMRLTAKSLEFEIALHNVGGLRNQVGEGPEALGLVRPTRRCWLVSWG